jgi:hypothetical protein
MRYKDMRSSRQWSDDQLTEAVKNNNTYRNVMRALGLTTLGANYKTVKKAILRLELDISHFLSKKELSNLARANKKEFDSKDFFGVNDIDRQQIKRHIIKNNLLSYQCGICTLVNWMGEPISLHLDHINGVSNDNRLENLRFLCPNCHAQTSTYCGKKLKGRKKIKELHPCKDCQREIDNASIQCKDCFNSKRTTKIQWLPLPELIALVKATSFWKAGQQLGVSDNAIRRHLRRMGIDPKTLEANPNFDK